MLGIAKAVARDPGEFQSSPGAIARVELRGAERFRLPREQGPAQWPGPIQFVDSSHSRIGQDWPGLAWIGVEALCGFFGWSLFLGLFARHRNPPGVLGEVLLQFLDRQIIIHLPHGGDFTGHAVERLFE